MTLSALIASVMQDFGRSRALGDNGTEKPDEKGLKLCSYWHGADCASTL